jgi:hypothetical protein
MSWGTMLRVTSVVYLGSVCPCKITAYNTSHLPCRTLPLSETTTTSDFENDVVVVSDKLF